MPKPLSMDLRSRIAQEFDHGILSLCEIAAKFEVSYPSVYRFHQKFKLEGHVNPKFSPRNTGNTLVKNIEEFQRFVLENNDMYQYEIGEKFGIPQSTVCSMLKKLGISRKIKHSPFLKKNEEKRKEFFDEIEKIPGENLFYFDESGVDSRIKEEYGYAPIGEKVFDERTGKRESRISLLGVYKNHTKEFLKPFMLEGSRNSFVVEAYFDKIVFPFLPKGSVVVLDNAAFHRKAPLKEIGEKHGCFFLPTYSPDLNPIEKCWANIKKLRLKSKDNLKRLIEDSIRLLTQPNMI